ncbi:MAG: competence/damage-inducible protein A [bacterium]
MSEDVRPFSILIIGDELLTGSKIESNSIYITNRLSEIGIDVIKIITVGDDEDAIINSINFCLKYSYGVIVSGGLGPTSDDRTKDAICKFLNIEKIMHQEILDDIRERFAKRGIDMPQSNVEQAYQPKGAILLKNPIGTAYGFILYKDNKPIITIPGVPLEMKVMMDESVLPYLREKGFGHSNIHILDAKVVGLVESSVYEKVLSLREWADERDNVTLAYYPHFIDVTVRVKVRGDESYAESVFNEARNILNDCLDDMIYGYGSDGLEVVVGRHLRDGGLKLSTAESCTGGLVSDRIVSAPGSSDYFLGGVISYSNEAKVSLLCVSQETLNKYGAVSPETAVEMAVGAKNGFNSDIAISTTGIAGPTGGTPEKPVGLVYIGWTFKDAFGTKKLMLGGMSRSRVRLYTSQMALEIVRRLTLGLKLDF